MDSDITYTARTYGINAKKKKVTIITVNFVVSVSRLV